MYNRVPLYQYVLFASIKFTFCRRSCAYRIFANTETHVPLKHTGIDCKNGRGHRNYVICNARFERNTNARA